MQYKFNILKRINCFKGFFKVDRLTLNHQLFAGNFSANFDREMFIRPDAACVLPFDPNANKIVLVEQFRVGAAHKSSNPWLLEVVAGIIDENETAEQTAIREANEEAGINITKLIPITSYYPSPGGSDERIHLFLGICNISNIGKFGGLKNEHEDIKIHTINLKTAIKLLEQGKLDNASTIIALQWLNLNLTKLQNL